DLHANQKIHGAVGFWTEPIDVLRDDGILAVRDTVLSNVSLFHVGAHALARPTAPGRRPASLSRHGGHASAAAATTASPATASRRRSRKVPLSRGISLPRFLSRSSGRRLTEAKEPRLLSGVELELQRIVVFPRHVQPTRLPQDPPYAVRLSLLPTRLR